MKPLYSQLISELDAGNFPDECLEWQAGKDKDGYGKVRNGKEHCRVHRVALSWKLGRNLEAKEFACHKCDNPSCYNPKHLFLGNAKVNNQDTAKKCRYPNQKVTIDADKVRAMKQAKLDGESVKDIATAYGVPYYTASQVIGNRRWT